jgi:hypothetical protein
MSNTVINKTQVVPTIGRRNPSRQRAEPERFSTLTFIPGSGPGGDQYDGGYNRGCFYIDGKDQNQKCRDNQYEHDLKKVMNVETITQNLPEELTRKVLGLVTSSSHYTNDIEFIAPDDVEPAKEIANDDEEWDEWESGDETEEDEDEPYLEDD